MAVKRALVLFVVVVLLVGVAFAALAWRPAIDATKPPAPASFDTSLVGKGEQLALIGNCIACHTAPGGAALAGGRALDTPYGTIYSTNITPDPQTGIGQWPEEAFARAMWRGVDREGRHLYPAFPYDHFNRVARDDVAAIYAYLMTREPVSAERQANRLSFPMNARVLLAGWKLLFLDAGGFRPDPSQNAEWNRGAYLAEGLGHCGACHTPRNALGAVQRKHAYDGGFAEGWRAPALNASSPSPVPWTADSLFRYLRNAPADLHDVPAGPMMLVSHALGAAPEADVRAIATYFASLMGPPTDARRKRADELVARARSDQSGDAAPPAAATRGDPSLRDGAAIYAGACAACHDAGRQTSSAGAMHLGLSSALALPTAANLVRVIVDGVVPPDDEPGRWMPAFGGAFTESQLTALVGYLRVELGGQPPWDDAAREVRKARQRAERANHQASANRPAGREHS